ncbi:MAG: LTA synthase family protein [Erysipelotrichaceae bacterium]|nr:LTA synthase family protein [Erysipelotrichaceae bacterium]
MGFTVFWYIANYYVIALRNKPIMPADLKAAGTAAEVLGGYTFIPSWKMILGLIIVLIYAVLLILVWKQNKPTEKQPLKTKLIRRGVSAIVAIALFFFGVNTNTFKSLSDFAWDVVLLKSFHEDGMVLTYLKSAYNSDIKKPEGYSKEIVDNYLKEYQTKATDNTAGIQPVNIVMVMNEAFSDLRDVGLSEQIDVMPFIDDLKENTIEGNCYVSIFGGGTCNTEFEALTGNSLAFFGSGAYPYTENVTDQLFSLAEYFRNIGYSTTSFHANNPRNWNRNIVYPYLGFETFYSIEDYKEHGEVEYLHDLPADISDYLFIESVNQQQKGQKQFLFNVTMQNHSGYERWLDVEKAESVKEYGSQLYEDTQIYLSLIKASDDEVKQLVEYYQSVEEPTMIIFFGDHQPGLPGVAINEIYTGVESYLDFYKTKFFIWTNYESEEIHDYKISANYLPWLILERGNFQLPPFVQMLKEVYSKYPVISSQGVMDSEGNIYTGIAEIEDDPLIKKYQFIQYANLFNEIDEGWFKIN